MIDAVMKSLFTALERNPDMRQAVSDTINFVAALDARLARNERNMARIADALGVVDFEHAPAPEKRDPDFPLKVINGTRYD